MTNCAYYSGLEGEVKDPYLEMLAKDALCQEPIQYVKPIAPTLADQSSYVAPTSVDNATTQVTPTASSESAGTDNTGTTVKKNNWWWLVAAGAVVVYATQKK